MFGSMTPVVSQPMHQFQFGHTVSPMNDARPIYGTPDSLNMWAQPPIQPEKPKPIHINEARQKSQQALFMIEADKAAKLQKYINDNRDRIIAEINHIIRSAVNQGVFSACWPGPGLSDYRDMFYQGYLRVISEEFSEFKVMIDPHNPHCIKLDWSNDSS